jgi:multidrug efflux pump subunit AcrA (membrane-fusion protein)
MLEVPETGSSATLKRAKFIAAGIVVALLIGEVVVLVLRSLQARALDESTTLHAKHYVTTILPKAGGGGQPLTLPGTLLGLNESTVYARSNGYIVRWLTGIGASVKKGDLLAEITSPEVDQELSQAISSRAQAAASASLAKTTAERWQSLRKKDAVTQQDLDERLSAYDQAKANLDAADANATASQTLFDAGKIRATVRIADADYTAAVATYRQTVLTAMEEVENDITGLTSLGRAAIQADASVHSAQRAYDIAIDRYWGGVDTYLDVITAEQTLLNNQRQAVQIHGQQFLEAVYLIKALGGGWGAGS